MKPYEELTLTDDFMFSKVFSDEKLCTELIELLLDIKVEKIEYFCKEKTLKEDFLGRGIRLDVYVKDSDRVFDIEIQTTNKHDLPQRARYYQAMMDLDNLGTGTKFTDLKETYVVFIYTFDPFDRDLAKYVFRERSDELNGLYLNDKTWNVFYNAHAYKKMDNKNVQKFLQYLTTKNPESQFTQKLDDAVTNAKGSQFWRKDYMTLAMKFDEMREDGRQEGSQQAKLESAKKMLSKNYSLQEISEITGLDKKQIQELTSNTSDIKNHLNF